jgi:MEMO1 family protein
MKIDEIPVFPLSLPAMRTVEMIPAEIEGNKVLIVRDPLGVVEGAPVLHPHPLLLVFVQLADGLTSLDEMSEALENATGQKVPASVFESIAQQLDQALLLQTTRFRDALAHKRDTFLRSPVRESSVFRHPPEARLEVIKGLGEELRRHTTETGAPPVSLDLPAKSVVGILAPHIDFQRGGAAYAWAYRALAEHGTDADTFIVLGTNHAPTSHRFVATRKAYDTPLGTVETDTETLDALAEAFGGELFEDEYAHASEHTVELQAVYLRHLHPVQTPRIVPILVGSFEELLADGGSPAANEEIGAFCAALRKVLQESNGKVGIIGAVDLSHCGPQFGD